MQTGETLIEVKDLCKHFRDGTVKALDGVDLTIRKGDVIVIIGPSGSGKSTFLRSLNLLETPTSGSVIVEGTDITKKKNAQGKKIDLDAHRRKMGMVFQHFNLFPHMTVLENLTIAPILVKKADKAAAKAEGRGAAGACRACRPRRRLPLASSPAGRSSASPSCARSRMEPDVMLFDEPTSALDPEMVGEVLDVMKQLARERHDDGRRNARDGLCPRGRQPRRSSWTRARIVEQGTPEDIFQHPQSARLQDFLSKVL